MEIEKNSLTANLDINKKAFIHQSKKRTIMLVTIFNFLTQIIIGHMNSHASISI